ncbi:MAG: response regulator [Flavobacteriales bacterium]|nr:response regulator [Flavobacteriales bacterium]
MTKLNEILLIEDDETTIFINERLIKKMDLTEAITIKTNGEKALNYLIGKNLRGEEFPDLIFLDLNMPVMDGFQFLENFRRLVPKQFKPPTIAVLTTSELEMDINRVTSLGISMYIVKTLDARKFQMAVRTVSTYDQY